jgi:hypothetical protein
MRHTTPMQGHVHGHLTSSVAHAQIDDRLRQAAKQRLANEAAEVINPGSTPKRSPARLPIKRLIRRLTPQIGTDQR